MNVSLVLLLVSAWRTQGQEKKVQDVWLSEFHSHKSTFSLDLSCWEQDMFIHPEWWHHVKPSPTYLIVPENWTKLFPSHRSLIETDKANSVWETDWFHTCQTFAATSLGWYLTAKGQVNIMEGHTVWKCSFRVFCFRIF